MRAPVIDFDTAEAMGLDGTLRTAREPLFVILNEDCTAALGRYSTLTSGLDWVALPFAYTWDTQAAAESFLRVQGDPDGTVYATMPEDERPICREFGCVEDHGTREVE